MDAKLVVATSQQQAEAAEHKNLPQRLRSLITYMACSLVAVHLARTACRARQEPRDLAFVLAASVMLALLLYCISSFETLVDAGDSLDDGESRTTRKRLRMSVWALSTALTVMFSVRVAAVLPPPLDLLVVAMDVAVAVGGFCLLFLCDAGHGDADCGRGGWATCDGKASEQEEKV